MDSYQWANDAPQQEPDTQEIELLHRVFQQTDDGQKLLDIWMTRFLFSARLDMNPSQYRQGFLDGQAHLPKVIFNAIRMVEEQ